jgi:hypothetical protein
LNTQHMMVKIAAEYQAIVGGAHRFRILHNCATKMFSLTSPLPPPPVARNATILVMTLSYQNETPKAFLFGRTDPHASSHSALLTPSAFTGDERDVRHEEEPQRFRVVWAGSGSAARPLKSMYPGTSMLRSKFVSNWADLIQS